jgi:hypothetical protein
VRAQVLVQAAAPAPKASRASRLSTSSTGDFAKSPPAKRSKAAGSKKSANAAKPDVLARIADENAAGGGPATEVAAQLRPLWGSLMILEYMVELWEADLAARLAVRCR